MNSPAEFPQLFFKVRQGLLKRRAPMRIRRSLREHAFPLQLQSLPQALALGLRQPVVLEL